MTEIAALNAIKVLLSAKHRSSDHGQMDKIAVSPGMSVLLFQTAFKCSPQYRPPIVWEVLVAEKQNDRILGSKGLDGTLLNYFMHV